MPPTELLFRAEPYTRTCEATVSAADAEAVRLDRTVFYPEGGGQPGDTGILRVDDGTVIAVTNTRKGETGDDILHLIVPDATPPAPGIRVVAELDWERRYRHMRMHTCLHLLSAVIDAPVPTTVARMAVTGFEVKALPSSCSDPAMTGSASAVFG